MAKKGYLGIGNLIPRPLPSGYTQVEYIESGGAQYIDTGFKPNQDTRVIADIQMVAENSLAANDIFGARTSASSKVFAVQWNTANNQFQHFYNNGYDNLDFGNFDIRQAVEMNKNVFTLNGVTHTRTYASFQCSYSLYIFAVNNAGSAQFYSNMRLYSCLIYDNGTLIRDYVPCLHDGTAGLYDMVNGVFYTNAGTGSFATGAAYQSDIARRTPRIYLGDANGLARRITKAYLGDKNGIAQECFISGTPIRTLAVGSSVFMNVDGVRTEFLVVHQGLPSSVYDTSCNGTWLLSKVAFGPTEWDSTDNDYENSDIHDYLNHDILNLFDSGIQNLIKQVKIPYTNGTGTNGSVAIGSSGLSTKIFLLSLAEMNRSFSDGNIEGAVLDYFDSEDSQELLHNLIQNVDIVWAFRSPSNKNTTYVHNEWHLMGHSTSSCTESYPFLPALILPSDAAVDADFNIIV